MYPKTKDPVGKNNIVAIFGFSHIPSLRYLFSITLQTTIKKIKKPTIIINSVLTITPPFGKKLAKNHPPYFFICTLIFSPSIVNSFSKSKLVIFSRISFAKTSLAIKFPNFSNTPSPPTYPTLMRLSTT